MNQIVGVEGAAYGVSYSYEVEEIRRERRPHKLSHLPEQVHEDIDRLLQLEASDGPEDRVAAAELVEYDSLNFLKGGDDGVRKPLDYEVVMLRTRSGPPHNVELAVRNGTVVEVGATLKFFLDGCYVGYASLEPTAAGLVARVFDA